MRPNVRSGSKIGSHCRRRSFRFTSDNGHELTVVRRPFKADTRFISGLYLANSGIAVLQGPEIGADVERQTDRVASPARPAQAPL